MLQHRILLIGGFLDHYYDHQDFQLATLHGLSGPGNWASRLHILFIFLDLWIIRPISFNNFRIRDNYLNSAAIIPEMLYQYLTSFTLGYLVDRANVLAHAIVDKRNR